MTALISREYQGLADPLLPHPMHPMHPMRHTSPTVAVAVASCAPVTPLTASGAHRPTAPRDVFVVRQLWPGREPGPVELKLVARVADELVERCLLSQHLLHPRVWEGDTAHGDATQKKN